MSILPGEDGNAEDFVFLVEAGEDIEAGDAVFIANGQNLKSVCEITGSGTAGSGSRAGITVVVPQGATRLNAFNFITTLVQSQSYNANVRRGSFTGTVLASFNGTFSATSGNVVVRGELDIAVTEGETLYIDFDGPNNARGAAGGVNSDISSFYFNGSSWVAEPTIQYAVGVQFDFGVSGKLYKAYAQTHSGTTSFGAGAGTSVDTITEIVGFALQDVSAGNDVYVSPLPLVRDLTGLTASEKHYLKDLTELCDTDANRGGVLSTTQTSSSPLIGSALSTSVLIRT